MAAATSKVKALKPKNNEQYTQTELFDAIQAACGFENRRIAKEVYLAMADMIQAALKKGYRIPLPGIGKIQVKQFSARMARNPQTGEQMRVPARKRVRLTPSKALKDAVL